MIPEEQSLIDEAVGPDVRSNARRTFWLTHMRIGFSVFLAETLAVMVYLGRTPHGKHRMALWIVVAAWLVFGLLGLYLAPKVAATSWRVGYSVAWTVLSSVAVGIVALLDSGSDSPILLLLFLPLVYAALMFSPAMAALCGVATLAVAEVVTIAGGHPAGSMDRAFMFLAVLAGGTVLSVAASVNRNRIEQHERHLLATIADLAATDGLTGCAVRRVLLQRMDVEIARSLRNQRPLSLLMMDVDQFKSINDLFGHVVGDRVLTAIAGLLRANARSFDLDSRLGGDEFALLLPDTRTAEAIEVAERIRHDLAAVVEVPVTLSIGVSSLDVTRPTIEQMINDADVALYGVKRSGRDAVAVRAPLGPPLTRVPAPSPSA
jgi:diguanylate cyclase (GGDEF)-like protein